MTDEERKEKQRAYYANMTEYQKKKLYERNKRYRERHAEALREKGREYYWAHREKRLETSGKYQKEHREYMRQKKREYYARNKFRILEKRRMDRIAKKERKSDDRESESVSS